MNDYNDFDSSVSELKKEIQYIKDRYDAPVEVLENLVKKINDDLFLYSGAYEEQKNHSDYLTNELKNRVIPAEINPSFKVPDDFITTPFSDDLGTENNADYYNQRELGEVHDTFNVTITNGKGNPITLTRQVIRCSQDDGSYLQSMVDVLSKLSN